MLSAEGECKSNWTPGSGGAVSTPKIYMIAKSLLSTVKVDLRTYVLKVKLFKLCCMNGVSGEGKIYVGSTMVYIFFGLVF